MVPLRMLLIVTLSYIFKITKFEMWLSRKGWELTKNAQVWLLYRLIFTIEWDHCECCTPWLWPNFSRSNISNTNISEWLAKHASYGFYRFWYLPLNGAIPKVVLCDVSLLFQGQIFQMLISRKRCELRKYVKYDFYKRWYLPSKSNHCENHTPRPWLAISWSKLQIFTKLFQQICLHLHGTRRRVALVWLVNHSMLTFINCETRICCRIRIFKMLTKAECDVRMSRF